MSKQLKGFASKFEYTLYDSKTGKSYQGTTKFFRTSPHLRSLRQLVSDEYNVTLSGFLSVFARSKYAAMADDRYVVMRDEIGKGGETFSYFKKWASGEKRELVYLFHIKKDKFSPPTPIKFYWGLEHFSHEFIKGKKGPSRIWKEFIEKIKDVRKHECRCLPYNGYLYNFVPHPTDANIAVRLHYPNNKRFYQKFKFID